MVRTIDVRARESAVRHASAGVRDRHVGRSPGRTWRTFGRTLRGLSGLDDRQVSCR